MDGEEPTQATQNYVDQRREGGQNSGFSDEDISDIVCLLYPQSDAARQEVQRLAHENSPFVIGRDEADGVRPDYDLEDHASRFESRPTDHGNYALILRLSARVKSPSAGFAFGRNPARCDLVFLNDPYKRVSNIHFRIYVNEFGIVMAEDQSTNGTWVDSQLLTSRPQTEATTAPSKWVLNSGSVISIYLHHKVQDLNFLVRIPHREDEYEQAYLNRVEEHMAKLPQNNVGTVAQRQTGPGNPRNAVTQPPHPPPQQPRQSPAARRPRQHVGGREWHGSGKYNKINKIGHGAFAVVYRVTSKYDGLPYAAKELEKRNFIKNGVLDQKVENEMKIMKRIHHPNIVQYIENFDWDDRLLVIIMEYVPDGDLGKLIRDSGPLPEEMGQIMSRQLLNALAYLHANNITHRDVKPDNILISSRNPLEVKLTDFGLSKMVESEQTFLRTFCGTLLYCAPEVYTEFSEYDENGVRNRGKRMRRPPGQRYGHVVDIWSLGGVVFYSLTGLPPYPTANVSPTELLHRIMTTELDTSPLYNCGISSMGIDFLRRMLQRRPEARATVDALDSHVWLGGVGDDIAASQSNDVITDDEEDDGVEPSQFRHHLTFDDEDRISDSMGEESEKENYAFDNSEPGPRLFGEVGVSAIGSSGVIPEDFLNLPHESHASNDGTEILDSLDDGYGSDEGRSSGFAHHHNDRTYRQSHVSIGQNQSADQLQSLVENVASQSLGDHDVVQRNFASAPPHLSTASLDFNSSKRKPSPSTDTSGEFDENTPPGKPMFKRLKSDGLTDGPADVLEEYKLIAKMPQIKRLGSGRQIDGPVPKAHFWEQDRATWHLNYPEMTQLQCDAFTQAARERGEQFGPGKTPLWAVAMKHFAPTHHQLVDTESASTLLGSNGATLRSPGEVEFPATAATQDTDSIPNTCPPDLRVVPVHEEENKSSALAMIESHPSSCVKIAFPITDSFVSFGRGPENSQTFNPKSESRVPKYAFKIMLWKDGYDPAKDPTKSPPPWQSDSAEDKSSYSFWISTKASVGIHINGYVLPSRDSRNHSGPSQHWTKLQTGDELLIWGNPDPARTHQTKVNFWCMWGASAEPRSDQDKRLELADEATAQKLDAACARTERRVRDTAAKRHRVREAKTEQAERQRNVERERQKSREFEERRQEAIQFLKGRNLLSGGSSRRESPAAGQLR